MTKHIELKGFNQGTALTTGTLALPPLCNCSPLTAR